MPALALIFLLALPLLFLSLRAAPALRVEIGAFGDTAFLTGVHAAERNPSENFRWSTARAVLRVPRLWGGPQLLRLRLHGFRPAGTPAPRVQVLADGRPIALLQTSAGLREYALALPAASGADTLVVLECEAVALPGDPRELGVALDWAELVPLTLSPAPGPAQLGGQALLLALALAQLALLRLPRGWAVAAGLALLAGLLAANLRQPLWVGAALGRWLIALAGLLAATWLLRGPCVRALQPWLTAQQADAAWALLVAAFALRLLGAAHPLFTIHDIGFHRPWLEQVTRGELYIYSTPSEFANRAVFNPPIGYVLIMPLYLLLPSTQLVLQVGTALVDALGCALLLPLARALRLTGRAALLALALYLALPINMTMLWWGFITNDMAQTVGLLLVVVLLYLARRPAGPAWLIFCTAAAAALLIHIGTLVLTVALLGAAVLLGWRRLAPASRRAALGGAALALALTGLIYFAAVASPALAQGGAAGGGGLEAALAKSWADRTIKWGLASKGWVSAFLPLPLALAPLGYGLLLGRLPRGSFERTLAWVWLAICLSFFGVYMSLGLLVRYIYFITPLVCLALGVLLARIWPRPGGRIVVLAIVLLVVAGGGALWAAGVLEGIKPTLVPLTH